MVVTSVPHCLPSTEDLGSTLATSSATQKGVELIFCRHSRMQTVTNSELPTSLVVDPE